MTTRAVCYTATAGYLFETVVSAVQARAHLDSAASVYVVFIGERSSAEYQIFSRLCRHYQIIILGVPVAILQGWHPVYARLFLDRFLPEEVREVLYLDGDTQVVGDITPLVEAEPPAGGALASFDPMVFIRRTNRRSRITIDNWWDSSGIPPEVRDTYVNAGVLRMARGDVKHLRDEALTRASAGGNELQFRDQDAINLALAGRIDPVSMAWNFPGFLLGTQLVHLTRPRIIHFMSNPRPWNEALYPWGNLYHQPYVDFVHAHPEVEPYWSRLTGARLLRYRLQQRFKRMTEGPIWQSGSAAVAVEDLERRTRILSAD